MIKRDRYENLSPKEYINVIIPYLRDLINEHRPTMELNSSCNNNNRAEWKIQLTMQNSCISTKVLKKHALYTQKVKH